MLLGTTSFFHFFKGDFADGGAAWESPVLTNGSYFPTSPALSPLLVTSAGRQRTAYTSVCSCQDMHTQDSLGLCTQ